MAPSTYYSAKSRPLSARVVRDAVMMQLLILTGHYVRALMRFARTCRGSIVS
jgi:hypothetical protein